MYTMRVFVTGSTGYIGRAVVEGLLRAGHEVVALERSGSARAWHLVRHAAQPSAAAINSTTRVRVFTADVLDAVALAEGMRGCDAVVHLVGIIREFPRRGVTMRRMHVEATVAVIEAAKLSGVGIISHMSALGARPDATSAYHRTKWEAEELVRGSGLAYTIFRPSVVFGRGGPGPNFVQQLADLVRRTPVVPVIGDGSFLLQPVSIETVARAFVQSVMQPRGRAYELGGPEVVSYLEILRRIAAALGKPLRTVRIPVPVMKRLVPALQHLPSFPITQDQLTMLLEGNVCSDTESAYRDFELEPVPFTATLA